MIITPGLVLTEGYLVTDPAEFSFTMTSADFTYEGAGRSVTATDSTTFTVNAGTNPLSYSYIVSAMGSDNNADQGFYTDFYTRWTAAGLAINSYSYAFDATWGPDSSPSSNVVFATFYYNSSTQGYLLLAPVSTSSNEWKITGKNINDLHGAPGVYNSPITLSHIILDIRDNDSWC